MSECFFQLAQWHTSFLSKLWLQLFAEFCLYLPTVSVNLLLCFSSRYLHTHIYAVLLSSSHCGRTAEADCLGIHIGMNSLEERRGKKKNPNPKERNREKQRWYKGMTRWMSTCLWSMHSREERKWFRVFWGATAGSEEMKLSKTNFLFSIRKNVWRWRFILP